MADQFLFHQFLHQELNRKHKGSSTKQEEQANVVQIKLLPQFGIFQF